MGGGAIAGRSGIEGAGNAGELDEAGFGAPAAPAGGLKEIT
jgi:hypothetical protein